MPRSPLICLGPLCLALALASFPRASSGREGGYASLTSVEQGQWIDLHVSTKLPDLSLEVYRNGEVREPMLTVRGLPGADYPCLASGEAYRTGCGWPVAYSLQIPEDWPSGLYEVEFPTWTEILSGRDTKIRFIVRENVPGLANILVVVPTNTYAAYNSFGGKSFYEPLFRPAVEVSYDRPTPPQSDTTSFFAAWAEREGYQVEYATDVDFHADASLLGKYSCFVTNGHSEYWSREMRDHLDDFTDGGGNALILSANTAWWQVRFSGDLRRIIAYKYEADPIRYDGDPSNDRLCAPCWYYNNDDPQTTTTGLSYKYGGLHDFIRGGVHLFPPSEGFGGYRVYRTGDWVFEGTGLVDGDMIGREATIAGYEMDGTRVEARDAQGNPAWDSDGYYPAPGALPYVVDTELTKTPGNFQVLGIAPATAGHGVMGYFEKPSGGTVFNSGTVDWSVGLESDSHVQGITANVVNRLCATRPGLRIGVERQTKRWFSVIIFGSDRLDVFDVDRRNLRLAGVAPSFDPRRWSFRRVLYTDTNEDGFADAVSAFHFRRKDLDRLGETICLEGSIRGQYFRACSETPHLGQLR